jgi:hypothetical protein
MVSTKVKDGYQEHHRQNGSRNCEEVFIRPGLHCDLRVVSRNTSSPKEEPIVLRSRKSTRSRPPVWSHPTSFRPGAARCRRPTALQECSLSRADTAAAPESYQFPRVLRSAKPIEPASAAENMTYGGRYLQAQTVRGSSAALPLWWPSKHDCQLSTSTVTNPSLPASQPSFPSQQFDLPRAITPHKELAPYVRVTPARIVAEDARPDKRNRVSHGDYHHDDNNDGYGDTDDGEASHFSTSTTGSFESPSSCQGRIQRSG